MNWDEVDAQIDLDAPLAARDFREKNAGRQLEALMPGVIEVTTYDRVYTKRGPNQDQMLSGF